MRHRGWLVLGALALGLAGCGEAPTGAPAGATPAAAAGTALPAATDEAGLRAAASRALAEQRLYAPAGDNAIEHYLAVRALAPADADVETALLELLPYAVIGSEQAIARGDFDEAQRLLALVQRTDGALPALARLRDQLAAAQADAALAAERAAREAEDAARREQAARLAAANAAPAPVASQAPSSTPGASSAAAASVPPPATEATAPSPAATAAATAAPPAAPRPAATPLPQLLSAPQPRYPPQALRRKLEGEVVLELRIEADGRVGSARVLSANPPGLFDDAAVAAASRWRFEAGAAAVTTRQVVRFRLPKEG
ncbi:MAG: hypothetical protein ABS41_09135 [Arenimonas sp. SCN 70-307]|uniref:energy transducer TonB n=1 Tax=Arenimonas sp. SCN 70-307 TaxID=1660089 RepID=UPI00086EACB7|nr:energy transducer TonB [Arenimonas sp. SCN 70-307]ODS62656.1 MAG: hypothetical protein ABS41_09135 [Arenimonas sp. SCN 70-307]